MDCKKLHVNPSAGELKKWTLEMATADLTEFNNPNIKTKILARSSKSTYVLTEDPATSSHKNIVQAEFDRIANIQDDYIRDQEMILIEGYIGNNPKTNTACRLFIEKSYANIAGMQQILYFQNEGRDYEAQLTVIYTPNLKAPRQENGDEYPDERLIAVDLENNVTRVFNSDYFGESKKGGLRMWNKLIYDLGGLPMHAGAKIIPVADKKKSVLIVGLSGTGKTTTTFSSQNNSQPVQDDFISLMPDGHVLSSENGCFAKTFGLDPRYEPEIYSAVCLADSYLENAALQADNKVDFFDDSYTQNGRAVFSMKKISNYAKAEEMGQADTLLILNRNENIIPAIARLSKEQAAAYFMLGETQGTSAGGKDEEGKALRVPGTNPFFPLPHATQGNRFLELLENIDLDVFLLNTGRVGGPDGQKGSKKIKIPHSSALVKAAVEKTITWEFDPDFGYEVASFVPGITEEDSGILQPRLLYSKQGREDEYHKMVGLLKSDRKKYMSSWPGIDARLVTAVS